MRANDTKLNHRLGERNWTIVCGLPRPILGEGGSAVTLSRGFHTPVAVRSSAWLALMSSSRPANGLNEWSKNADKQNAQRDAKIAEEKM